VGDPDEALHSELVYCGVDDVLLELGARLAAAIGDGP
jgi:hypothetical protein